MRTLATAVFLALVALPAAADEPVVNLKAGPGLDKVQGNCGACHAVKSKVVGPAYKDVAQKRKAEPDAIAKLMATVRAGSKGTYGPIPMPPVGADKIGDADLHDLIEWILSK